MSVSEIDVFVSRLYQSTQDIDIGHFRNWALNELRELISFDACIWSTGHLSTRTFHTHTLINLPQTYPEDLRNHLPINPISKYLFSHPDEPVDMSDVVSDEEFFQSEIYEKVFKQYGIDRILSSIHIDSRSGVYTLLTLYRKDREHVFTSDEKTLHQSALYHLINSATMAGFASLGSQSETLCYSAICDRHGIYHAVEESFLDLIEENFPKQNSQQLPFDIELNQAETKQNNLQVMTSSLGELFKVTIRRASPLDSLTKREREVVDGVTNGLSFKQIAKSLSLSPSTVSNHLYRIYQKLNISNRSELAELIQE